MEDDREREAGWLDGWQLNPLLLLFRPTIVAGCVSLSVSSGKLRVPFASTLPRQPETSIRFSAETKQEKKNE
jgi:hypothetical protein